MTYCFPGFEISSSLMNNFRKNSIAYEPFQGGMFCIMYTLLKLKLQISHEFTSFVSAWNDHDYIYRELDSCTQKVMRVCGRT